MAKGQDKKNTNQMISEDRTRNLAEHTEDRTKFMGREQESYDRQKQTYEPAFTGYKNFAETGGLTDADKERLRATLNSGGGGGGYDAGLASLYGGMASGSTIDQDKMRVGMPTLQELMATGGYDPAKEALIQGDITELRALGRTGGMGDEEKNAYRGNGVFKEFSETGGLSELDRQMLRARGNSGIASLYGQGKEELSRLNRVSGGNQAGTGALLSRLTREGSRAAADAALNTELGITDRVNEGRRYGATSLSQGEAALQDRLANTKLTGLLGATEHGRGIEEFKGKTKLGASEVASGVEANIASLLASERARGASGLAGLASAGSANASNSARDRLALEKYLLEYGQGNQFAGLEGLGRLNTNSLSEGDSYRNFLLGERGLTQNTGGDLINSSIGNRGPGFNWGGVIGATGGILGSLLGGGGSSSGQGGWVSGAGSPRKPDNEEQSK